MEKKQRPYPPVYYNDYLQLDKLLDSQLPKSEEYGYEAHDETLFIIVHQAYELWFKQILHELGSVMQMFDKQVVNERNIGTAIHRLQRITEIQRLLIDQLRVLETMTPLDFLDFRDFLVPASGFQSLQFRIIENKLGLHSKGRVTYNNKSYHTVIKPIYQEQLLKSEQEPSMFNLINNWLERTPFVDLKAYDFTDEYKVAVDAMLKNDEQIIKALDMDEEKRKKQFEELEKTRKSFQAIFDEKLYASLVSEGFKRFSHKAMVAALFIHLYRDEPILHMPFRLLTLLVDIDENFTSWRYKHALMVHRMIGSKIGTGGSSGHHYLLQTAEKHKVFRDLFDLSTYMIPRSMLPPLPEEIRKMLGYCYSYRDDNANIT